MIIVIKLPILRKDIAASNTICYIVIKHIYIYMYIYIYIYIYIHIVLHFICVLPLLLSYYILHLERRHRCLDLHFDALGEAAGPGLAI